MSRYPLFDRGSIRLRPLKERGHDLTWEKCRTLEEPIEPLDDPEFPALIDRIIATRPSDRPVVLLMGGHPVKLGLSHYLIDLLERGFVTHLATNGSGLIHDFELSLIGGTSEDVSKWIAAGQFGLWQETGRLNEIIVEAAARGEGLGEAVGRTIVAEQFPLRDLSLAATGWRLGIPVTCHVTVGGDIIHPHPNCDGAALGAASYTDFLIFARAIQELEGGVFLNIGSAVTGPEVYLKALSMARNVAHQHGISISRFTTAVFDLVTLPRTWRDGTPTKAEAQYYYRPWKTILIRTVQDGGESFYFCGDHRQTIPRLWWELVAAGL